MFCDECGAKIEENSRFCPICGTVLEKEENDVSAVQAEQEQASVETAQTQEPAQQPVETAQTQESVKQAVEAVQTPEPVQQTVFCGHCGAQIPEGSAVCPFCGKKLAEGAQQAKRKMSPVVWIALAVAAVCAAAFLFVMPLLSGGNKAEQLMYIKDDALMCTSLKKIEPMEIDDNVIETDDSFGSPFYRYRYYGPTYTADQKHLIYPVWDADYNISKLYYIEAGRKDAEPEKIDSDIDTFHVTKKNEIIYKKDENLYIHNLKDKEKIASDVKEYYVSEDGAAVIWVSVEEGKMYYQDTALANEKEKLDSDVTLLCSQSGDLKNIVYVKDDALYLLTDLTEKEKISADVQNVIAVSDVDGDVQVLYQKSEEMNSLFAWDVIDDDMAAADKAVTEPNEKDYQTERTEEGFWGPRVITETDDAYYEDLQKYYEKLERDGIREMLKERSIEGVSRTSLQLYQRSENSSTMMLDGWIGDFTYNYGMEDIVTAVQYCDMEELPKLKFSKVCEENGIYSLESDVEAALQKETKTYIVMGNRVEELFDSEYFVDDIQIDQSNDTIYMLVAEEVGSEGKIEYQIGKIDASDADSVSFEKLYSDTAGIVKCWDGKICYMKDADAEAGTADLYLNDERIAYDVSNTYGGVNIYGESILYLTDCADDGSASLYLYRGDKPEKIKDEVYDFHYYDDRKIALLLDVSKKSGKGDLKLYNGKEVESVDTDVYGIVVPGNA